MKIHRQDLPGKNVQSLCWAGDTLIDWVGACTIYGLDGSLQPPSRAYSYRFDAVVMSPSGRFTVLYERLGTKGLLLDEGRIVRELNRSFYQAHVFVYPVAFIRQPDGRELLAHCPDEYCRLELEDVLTGARLTARPDTPTMDVFFSRLAASPSGRHLLSAGWVWHPWDVVHVYDVAEALATPTSLDQAGLGPDTRAEVASAAWVDDQTLTITITTSAETEPDPDDPDADPLLQAGPHVIGLYDLPSRQLRRIIPVGEPLGELLPLGTEAFLNLAGHPSLIDATSGAILERWPDLPTGGAASSIQWHLAAPPPPIALDPARGRLAIASADGSRITVLTAVSD